MQDSKCRSAKQKQKRKAKTLDSCLRRNDKGGAGLLYFVRNETICVPTRERGNEVKRVERRHHGGNDGYYLNH